MLVKYDKMYNLSDERAKSSKYRINTNYKKNVEKSASSKSVIAQNPIDLIQQKKGPSFEKMTSRPSSKDCLPFYMKVLFVNLEYIFKTKR